MTDPRPNDPEIGRLDEIATRWSLLRLAHQSGHSSAAEARQALVLRYSSAVRNYVGALIHHDADADEVAQEVIVRLLRGQFASASPERGSFRRMLMVAAHNMVRNYWRKQKNLPEQDVDLKEVLQESETPSQLEEEGMESWRQSLLAMAWQALEEYQRTHPGSVAHTLLRLRVENPDDDSDTLAQKITNLVGKPFRADALRQQLRRARVRFVQALLEEVARGLDDPTPDNIKEELHLTGLMPFVKDMLPDTWKQSGMLGE